MFSFLFDFFHIRLSWHLYHGGFHFNLAFSSTQSGG